MATLSNGNNISPALLALLVGGSGAAGAFPTPSQSSSTTVGNTNNVNQGTSKTSNTTTDFQELINQAISRNQGSTTQTGFSTPTLSPATQAFMDQLIGQFSGLAGKNTDKNAQTMLATQIGGINKNSAAQDQLTQETLAARGLSGSPIAATAQIGNQNSRFQQINQAQNNLPLLQQQLQLQSLVPASAFFSSIPTGQVNGTTGTVDNTGFNNTNSTQNNKSTNDSTAETNNTGTNITQQGTDVSGTVGGGLGQSIGGIVAMLAQLFGGGQIPGSIYSPTGTPSTLPTNANGQPIPTTLPPGSSTPNSGLGALLKILTLGMGSLPNATTPPTVGK
jgi:hypothetical protein